MKSTTIEKDKILNYIIYAEFYVSQFSISIKRVPNITIDQEDLKSSILNIRNSIKKIKRFIERDKEIKDIEQIYSSSKKQFDENYYAPYIQKVVQSKQEVGSTSKI